VAMFFLGVFVGGLLVIMERFLHIHIDGFKELASYLVLVVAFVIGFSWPLLRGQSWSDFRQVIGLHAGKGVFRELFGGLVGYVAGLPIIFAGLFISYLLENAFNADTSHPITDEVIANPDRLWIYLALACVWAPISEEILFRGMLFSHLRERFGFASSAVVVAVVFAAIHPQGWAAIPALGSIALVFVAIREWRDSILGSIAAHALHNGLTMLMLIVAVT
ncbi:MAG: CPBP family intramembrane metalloprotease, partial [Phycisphaerales bacterium]|nr:CPBP family intramembrane metalloprotease [Phycisphaerales bacterium]